MTTPTPLTTPIPFSQRPRPRTLCLFDVDGTLSLARQAATPQMLLLLERLRKECAIGFVGGSDLSKIREQLQPKGAEDPIHLFDYGFAENGLTAFRFGQQLSSESFVKSLGEQRYKKLARFCLNYIANEMEDIPVMRGTFIEFRNGMINVSPIGRNASIAERNTFELFDKEHHVREKFIAKLKENFPEKEWPLTYSIGGKISFDVFPNGWDKTYALKHVEKEKIGDKEGWEEIHFFGDKTYKGGNDHEIFEDIRTIGHTVTSPEHTMQELEKLFFSGKGSL